MMALSFTISRLRLGCQGTYFHESETEVRQFVITFAILVQSACKTYRVGEADPENFT